MAPASTSNMNKYVIEGSITCHNESKHDLIQVRIYVDAKTIIDAIKQAYKGVGHELTVMQAREVQPEYDRVDAVGFNHETEEEDDE